MSATVNESIFKTDDVSLNNFYIMKTKRFFLVAYAHETGFANTVTTTDGTFVNCNKFTSDAQKELGHQIAIISVQELSEQDANDYLA